MRFFTNEEIAANLPEGVAPSPGNMRKAKKLLNKLINDFVNSIDLEESLASGDYKKNLFWYAIDFYGAGETNSPDYVPGKAETWIIKTEIPPKKGLAEAADILLEGMETERAKELRGHVTSVRQVDDKDAYFYSVEHLTKRVSDHHGTYYISDNRD